MSEENGPARRRRQRRTVEDRGAVPEPAAASPAPPGPAKRKPARDRGDGGMRDLVGSGRSQLGISGALRARDVNRPTEDDLAEAEREVTVVRRQWRPESSENPADLR